ncbi:hypothetical protein NDU88_007997 [Pleurodeles waltl]|uniref:Secreted protein n=1 Tax=Pleurodeles waltl TaxID=8319 RepID=A0AAV7NXL8_PLEWA|nr:hypothetical protein NDU88_007997 [Pleurodeles waltl]
MFVGPVLSITGVLFPFHLLAGGLRWQLGSDWGVSQCGAALFWSEGAGRLRRRHAAVYLRQWRSWQAAPGQQGSWHAAPASDGLPRVAAEGLLSQRRSWQAAPGQQGSWHTAPASDGSLRVAAEMLCVGLRVRGGRSPCFTGFSCWRCAQRVIVCRRVCGGCRRYRYGRPTSHRQT